MDIVITGENMFGFGNNLRVDDKNAWPEIIDTLVSMLEEASNKYYSLCVNEAEKTGSTIKHRTNGGKAKDVILAYQLFLTSGSLSPYISPENGEEFASLLYHRAGGDSEDIQKLWKSFYEVEDDNSAQFVRFQFPLLEYIVGNKPKEVLAASIYLLQPTYIIRTFTSLAVASSFKDKKQIEKIKKYLKNNF